MAGRLIRLLHFRGLERFGLVLTGYMAALEDMESARSEEQLIGRLCGTSTVAGR
jgi:hypothetical protein